MERQGVIGRRTRDILAAIEERDPLLRAFIHVTSELARWTADAQDAGTGGPLRGMTVAVKDCIDVAGVATTHGWGRFRANRATADAPVVARLRAAGAIVVGKANLHQFAMGATTRNADFGDCRNPWDGARVPGGSSGGSAVAVAAGMCDVALGTDTGGSIRNPSTYTGIVGLRPTHGSLPMGGILPVSPMCDTVGPMARTVGDVRLAYEVMAGLEPSGDEAEGAGAGVTGLRVGVLRGYFSRDLDPHVGAALDQVVRALEAQGARATDIDLAGASWLERALGQCVMVADAAALHRSRLERHADAYEPGVRDRLALGASRSASDYATARRVIARWRRVVARAFERFDLLVGAATTGVAPLRHAPGGLTAVSTGINHLNIPWSGAGTPVIAVPCGLHPTGLPMGIQLVARWGDETRLLDAAAIWERISGGFPTPPGLPPPAGWRHSGQMA